MKKENTLLVFACSRSLKENLSYGIYYDPAERNHNKEFEYLGFYYNKAVVAIGRLKKIVACDYIDSTLKVRDGYDSTLTQKEHDDIISIIQSTKVYDIKSNCKFFILENTYDTNFSKSSKGPLRAKCYIDLTDYPNYKEGMSPADIAKYLSKCHW